MSTHSCNYLCEIDKLLCEIQRNGITEGEVKGHLLDMIRNLVFLVTKIEEHEDTSRQLLEFGVDKKAKK